LALEKNILIVTDDLDTWFILKQILEGEGYTVFLAKDEKETFDVLASSSVHLILLDFNLGSTNIFKIYKKIKSKMNLTNIPIIAIYVPTSEEFIIKAIELGFDGFIEKPFNNEILKAKIASIIRIKEEEEQLRKSREELIQQNRYTSRQKELLGQEAEFSRELIQCLDAESMKAFLRERLSSFLVAYLFTIFIIDESRREFKLFVTNHEDIPSVISIDRESIMYAVLRKKTHIFLKNFNRSHYRKSNRRKYITNVVCTAPLISRHRTIGVLNVNDPELSDLGSFDFEGRIERISGHLAVSINNTTLYEELKNISMRDSMTGLYNYEHFLEVLKHLIELAERSGKPLSCIMLDIDDFKNVNDTFLHQGGDTVLKELAQCVSNSIRRSDIPARRGGDEFCIAFPNTDKSHALKLARRVWKWCSGKEISIPDMAKHVKVTISIGIAAYPEHARNMDDLMNMADEALYLAKSTGKNKIVIYGE
jgi:two-component system cell cycle response regulator